MPQKHTFDLVVACTVKGRGIGQAGQIPWKLKKDLAFFKQITQIGKHKNTCIMGRSTYESIGRLLPGRYNIVLSKGRKIQQEGLYQACSLR
jgi:dihydrofolate reductase